MRYLPAMADFLIQIGNGYWLTEDMDEYVKNENRTSKKGSFTVLCTLEQGRYVF